MTTAYSSLMGLALPVQGELSGTWGDTVNNGITNYLDVALAGTQTISGSQTAVTLSLTNGNASATNIAQAGSGATGSAQYAIINCTGNPASLLTVTVPASSRQYVVINATSTSQSVKVVGVGPTTGVTIVSGEKAHIVWNGSDFVKIASTSSVSSFSAGTTGLTPNSATTGAVTLAGTLATTNGGTGLTSFTANGVMYASSTSALTTGSALTFNGTVLYTNGKIGVGEINPTALVEARNTSIARMDADASAVYFGSGNNYPVVFKQNDTEGMRLTSTGLGIGTSSPSTKLQVNFSSATAYSSGATGNGLLIYNTSTTTNQYAGITFQGEPTAGNAGQASIYGTTTGSGAMDLVFSTRGSSTLAERMRIDSAGYMSGVWADKVTALGNSGTATTITCTNGNVFTATLTGNCTFTLASPSTTTSNTATSFTLVLTNDGTAGRTVAFSGGTFKYPGGSVTRTTTANAVDIWFFFSPDGGTTWYVSIPMANLS